MAEVLFYFSLIRLLSMPVTMTTAKVMSKESVALSKVGLSRWLFVKFRHQLGWQRTLERMVAMMMFICVVFNGDFQFFSMLIWSCGHTISMVFYGKSEVYIISMVLEGLFRGLQHFRYANNVVPLWITASDGFYAEMIGFIKSKDKWCRGYENYDKNYDDKGQICKKV